MIIKDLNLKAIHNCYTKVARLLIVVNDHQRSESESNSQHELLPFNKCVGCQ